MCGVKSRSRKGKGVPCDLILVMKIRFCNAASGLDTLYNELAWGFARRVSLVLRIVESG